MQRNICDSDVDMCMCKRVCNGIYVSAICVFASVTDYAMECPSNLSLFVNMWHLPESYICDSDPYVLKPPLSLYL